MLLPGAAGWCQRRRSRGGGWGRRRSSTLAGASLLAQERSSSASKPVQYNERVSFFDDFFQALNAGNVRYVVVGGVAVVLHGHPRMTADIDLVVDLEPVAAEAAIRTLTGLGLRPRVPVDAADFADPAERQRWIDERGMKVFNLYDPRDPLRSVDLFVESPLPFDELWGRATIVELPSGRVRVASIQDLITMKKAAGRRQDSADIEALEAIRDGRSRKED